uniref:Aromatic amino acid beta-eliminating lyase/threonine aldolase domain-containing protein n=1 Tax=Meloidogyne incognita TaxID=6306 RepID=A0A914NYF2_MELIC
MEDNNHHPTQNGKEKPINGHKIILTSDNWTGAHHSISEALLRHSAGCDKAYGAGDLDKKIERTFNQIFEREVAVYFVGTGTAANALAMAYLNRPGGIIFAHKHAMNVGLLNILLGGARMFGVDGALGKMDSEELRQVIARFPANPDHVHSGQAMAVSITQSTESGTVYSLEEIKQISKIAHDNGLPLHMDGARFANALCALNCTPAEMSWKAGVDILSFGATKNGCWCAEAIIVFNDIQQADRNFPYLRKRAAHLFSKTRFVAAQFEAYFRDDLWLKNARHANKMATRLASIIQSSNSCRLAWEVRANEVFVVMSRSIVEMLKEQGTSPFYEWNVPDRERKELNLGQEEGLYRLVATFATTKNEVDEFGKLLSRFS